MTVLSNISCILNKLDKTKQLPQNRIYDAIQNLESGESSYLKIVYEAFALQDREIVRKAGHAIKVYLEDKTSQYIIRLSERFRECTSLEWFVSWKTIDIRKKKSWFESEQDYVYALIVGSFHPNGYFREICSKELCHYPNTLGYMLLRTNDWVEEIRTSMFSLALDKMANCSVSELFFATQYMEKISRSGRIGNEGKETLAQLFYDRIEETLPDFPLDKIKYYEFAIRKMIYKLLMKKKVLDISDVNYLLEREKHSFCKQILITGILQYYDCTEEQIAGYMKNKNSVVRRKAMEYQYLAVKDYWDGLEMMLLDQNKGVRELASYIISHHSNISILDFYLGHLQDDNPMTAIVGIGETGGAKEGRRLLPFLKNPDRKVVSASITALSKTIETEGDYIYLEYLKSEEPSVSKAAYYAIRYNYIHYGAKRLHEYCTEYRYPHIRKYALHLLIQENSWDRLPYLLDLYAREGFEEYQYLILTAVERINTYGKISKQQEEEICNAIKKAENRLPENILKMIRFSMKFLVEQ